MSDDSDLDDADDVFKIPTTPSAPATRTSADLSSLEALRSPLSLSQTGPSVAAAAAHATLSTQPPADRRSSIRFKDEAGAALVQEAETYSPDEYDRSNSDYDIDRNSIDAEIEVRTDGD